MICLINRRDLIEAPICYLKHFSTLAIYQEWDAEGEELIFLEKIDTHTFHVL